MDSKKFLLVIPLVSAFVLAAAIGLVAFSSSLATDETPIALAEGEDNGGPLPWKRGILPGFDHGGRFGFRTGFDYDAYIAEELGVSVEELQAARQAAHEAALDQAVEEGLISAEQADLILAGQALKQYIDPQEILSQALGIDVADLEAAREAGENLQYLFGDMEPEEIREALQAAYQDAVEQAIEDGVISAEQAEQLRDEGFPGRMVGKRGHSRGAFPFPIPGPEGSSE
jgi:hypothetical protein